MFDRFARLNLAHLPTPLERLERLSAELGGPEIWIKRDDCTGLSTGGNKTRKLEFLMADAVAQGAEIVVTQGATQSNHARQTAAAAAKVGLECHLILEDTTGYNYENYRYNGNVLLDILHGATIEHRPPGLDMNEELDMIVQGMRDVGRNVYGIPGGGSNALGTLGYVTAAVEVLDQIADRKLNIDHVVHATGSGGTQAGLLIGFKAARSAANILGFSIHTPKKHQETKVRRLVRQTEDLMKIGRIVEEHDVQVNSGYVGLGYGMPADDTIEAIELFAKTEGILLDPVYTGKAAAGMIDMIRKGKFKDHEKILFWHTGGAMGLPAYTHEFDVMALA